MTKGEKLLEHIDVLQNAVRFECDGPNESEPTHSFAAWLSKDNGVVTLYSHGRLALSDVKRYLNWLNNLMGEDV